MANFVRDGAAKQRPGVDSGSECDHIDAIGINSGKDA
jgi:hypothetical protein